MPAALTCSGDSLNFELAWDSDNCSLQSESISLRPEKGAAIPRAFISDESRREIAALAELASQEEGGAAGVDLKAEIGALRDELRRLGRFGRLLGTSEGMQSVYDHIERVAPTGATVLITGESGTGKELVAQTLHDLSRRRRQP